MRPGDKDLIGETFGSLTVAAEAGVNRHGKRLWLCNCSCGSSTTVPTGQLTSGRTSSCGCLRKSAITQRNMKHGFAFARATHPLYHVWVNMKSRCSNPNATGYEYYGGRGIVVCKEWAAAPKAFVEWGLQHGWQAGLEIDRINCDGPYAPTNCRFVTKQVNMNNRRCSKQYKEAA